MPTSRQISNLSEELQKLIAKRKELETRLQERQQEIDERIKLVKQSDVKRQALFVYIKKQGLARGDLLWAYQQLPPTRITKASRLKRHATNKSGTQYPPKPELMPLGKQIRALRMAKQMTKSALAKAVDVHGSMITGWENGMWRIKDPVFAKLEKVLGQPLIKPRNPNASEEK